MKNVQQLADQNAEAPSRRHRRHHPKSRDAAQTTLSFALLLKTSGVRLYASSISAIRNELGPLTSGLAAATSAATLMASKLHVASGQR